MTATSAMVVSCRTGSPTSMTDNDFTIWILQRVGICRISRGDATFILDYMRQLRNDLTSLA